MDENGTVVVSDLDCWWLAQRADVPALVDPADWDDGQHDVHETIPYLFVAAAMNLVAHAIYTANPSVDEIEVRIGRDLAEALGPHGRRSVHEWCSAYAMTDPWPNPTAFYGGTHRLWRAWEHDSALALPIKSRLPSFAVRDLAAGSTDVGTVAGDACDWLGRLTDPMRDRLECTSPRFLSFVRRLATA